MTTLLCESTAEEARRSLDDVKPKRSVTADTHGSAPDLSALDLSGLDLWDLDLPSLSLPSLSSTTAEVPALDVPVPSLPVPVASVVNLPVVVPPAAEIPALPSPVLDIPAPATGSPILAIAPIDVAPMDAPETPTPDAPATHMMDAPEVLTPDAPAALAPETSVPAKTVKTTSTREELALLAIKVGVVAIMLGLFFTFLYGARRCGDADMSPSVKDGDITLFCRWDRTYAIGDLVVLNVNGVNQVRRVVAEPGDIVDITPDGLMINGELQDEPNPQQVTLRYAQGPAFPLTVGPNQIFVLGDSRENATDSRVYGPVNDKDTLGKVIGIIRMRDL